MSNVCPALAGMSPGVYGLLRREPRLPRTRGDEPVAEAEAALQAESAPHSRG